MKSLNNLIFNEEELKNVENLEKIQGSLPHLERACGGRPGITGLCGGCGGGGCPPPVQENPNSNSNWKG